jgi:hypothetical protein
MFGPGAGPVCRGPWNKWLRLDEERVGLPSRLTARGSIGAGTLFLIRELDPLIGKGHRRSLSLDQPTAAPQSTQWPECSLCVAGLFPGKSNGNSDSALDCQLLNSGLYGEIAILRQLEDHLWR